MQLLEAGLYTFPIPLPDNPLKALNGYLLLGASEAVMIDTGFAMDPCREAVDQALKQLGITADRLTVVLTHLHSDHTGLAGELGQRGARILCGTHERWWIERLRSEEMAAGFQALIDGFGLTEDGVRYEDNPGYKYAPAVMPDLETVKEGDRIQVGAFDLEVIDLPGHTPGLIGLYCRERGCLFGADHVLDQITPNISYWKEGFDSLGVYLEMLEKARALKLRRVYPAHRNIIEDPDRRMDELRDHHAHRLAEVLQIVGSGSETVREIASRMHWDLRALDWESFPKAQKWFACSEAMAHLEYLRLRGQLKRTLRDGRFHFAPGPASSERG